MAQNDWAIVIGINEYEHHPERNLRYAVNDAQLMQEFLCSHAGFPKDQVVLCLGEAQYQGQPTYPSFANLIRWINRELHPSKIGEVNRFWFFFSGHGLSTEGNDYLITCDSLLEDSQFNIMLPVQQVIAALRQHDKADVVLVLDNCREQVGAKNLASRSLSEESVKLACENDIVTIRSCEYGEFSYEIGNRQQGAFTSALLEGLKYHTLPTPLERYLQQQVTKLNQESGIRNRQTPKISLNSSGRGQFPLLPERCVTAADLEALEKQALKAQAMSQYKAAERIWWQIIRATQSRQMLDEAQEHIQFLYRTLLAEEIRQKVQQELNQLRQQAEEATRKLQALEEQQGDLGQQKAELERQLAQVKQEAAQQLAALRQQQEAEREEWQAEAVKQVQRAQDSAQAKINELTATLETLQTQLAAKEKRKQQAIADQTQQAKQIEQLNQKIEALEKQLKQASQILHQPKAPSDEVVLESEKGVDYTKLRDLLKAQKWKEADRETYRLMITIVGRKEGDYCRQEDLLNFPCKDLKTIDRLWVQASQGRYGFSVQKEIYVRCGAKLDGEYPGDEIWRKFGTEVGWRVNNEWQDYDDLTWNSIHVPGHLPCDGFRLGFRCGGGRLGAGRGGRVVSSLAQRLVKCNL